ncbi:MAG: TIGR03557 family F420-dependent LLM class oxidoreductase [Dactylosporangium sp.]|nr:TIGR03557 family F420-dependent LLM class oxidoreductase [Dactylosporangium sp.]NNJ60456.1 TIGR03557 family F420-dependent LLM class oxidoreductase [Dactylosporangium sp.]
MAHIGYAAMAERFHPNDLIDYAAHAERAGFRGTMVADHVQPWVPAQGHAPFVWNVLTATGARTTGDLGPGVTCPSYRMHPATVAQASATLAAMYPGRHWLGLGSGEALNEHIVGAHWPEAPVRLRRMWEAVDLIGKLFTGADVRHAGECFTLETCRLWTMPDQPPPIYIATSGPVTARRAGRTVDGFITPGAPVEKLASLLGEFNAGVAEAGRDPARSVRILQVHLSWAATDAEATASALREWPNGGMAFAKQDIRSPLVFEQIARLVRPEDFAGRLLISSDPDAHRQAIQRYLDLGFDRIYLHNVGRDQVKWIDVFARDVLPRLTA